MINFNKAVYFDTEFIEDGKTIIPLSIGMTTEWGWSHDPKSDLYIVFTDVSYESADKWVQANVIPYLRTKDALYLTRAEAADTILDFVTDRVGKPEFWADYAAYDWVLLCQLYGRMIDLPDTYPMFCRDVQDLKQFVKYPTKLPEPEKAHNALSDAYNVRERVKILSDYGYRKILGK